jgi:DNA-binding NarL/FixJ family response regulator
MIVAGITDRLSPLLAQLEASQPDVVLLGWEMPFQSLAELLFKIHHLEHPPKIILLSCQPADKEKMLVAGADYFFLKNAPPDGLLLILTSIQGAAS